MWTTDAQRVGSHMAGFNPDARANPHDVFQTGPGKFKAVGRFDPLASSVGGGIFGGQPDERPRGNVAAVQRVKALPTGGGDFLDRLALAEARDTDRIHSDRMHAAGARPEHMKEVDRDSRPKSAAPTTQYARAAKILEAHQSVQDNYAQAQQERQWRSVQKQHRLVDQQTGRAAGEAAAGTKSRALRANENLTTAQAQTMQHSWQQQSMSHQHQKQRERQDLAMQTAEAQRSWQQQQQMQRQQAQRAQQLQKQSAMKVQQQEHMQQQHMQHMQQQHMQAAREVAMKSAWAKNQAARRNSGGFQFG